MTKRYYAKEIPESPCWIFGQPYRFDLLATEDPVLIQELDKCVRKGIGGISALSESNYTEELKKKQDEKLLQSFSKPSQRRNELSALNLSPSASRAVGRLSSGGTFAQRQRPEGGIQSDRQAAMPEPIGMGEALSALLHSVCKWPSRKSAAYFTTVSLLAIKTK